MDRRQILKASALLPLLLLVPKEQAVASKLVKSEWFYGPYEKGTASLGLYAEWSDKTEYLGHMIIPTRSIVLDAIGWPKENEAFKQEKKRLLQLGFVNRYSQQQAEENKRSFWVAWYNGTLR